MSVLRALLVLIFVVVAAYTGLVISSEGLGLLPAFFAEIAKVGWQGQFNLDFLCLLLLLALWVAYRHRFGAAGLALGLAALTGGVLFLSVYLLVESLRTGGDVRALLLGRRWAS